jgi:hypothetical protein
VDRDDRLQRLRLLCGGVEGGDTPVRLSEHADPAGRPLAVGQPLDDLRGLSALAAGEQLVEEPGRAAGADHVGDHHFVVVSHEVPDERIVPAVRDHVVPRVRDVHEQRGVGSVAGRLQPRGCDRLPVRRDPEVFVSRYVYRRFRTRVFHR